MWYEESYWGTHGKYGVKFYKMIPKNGYTCLGHIAVNQWAVPDKEKYRY